MESEALPRINRVIVTGFMQQQPELRHTPSGVAVASFRVRSGRVIRDRRGLLRETVSTFTVVTWQDLAVRVCQEAKIGQGVYVEGSLHSRSFVAGNGERLSRLKPAHETIAPARLARTIRTTSRAPMPRTSIASDCFRILSTKLLI